MIDVLVIGAGPTGMMMAREAARYGLTGRIIDKGVTYRDESRAAAIQARTLEIFDQIGIVKEFLAQGIAVQAGTPISNFKPLGRLSFEKVESPYPFVLSLEQQKTEKILSTGLNIERGKEFVRLEQDEEGVDVFLKDEKIRASWVIGCDGAHSSVRKELNIPFEGRTISDVFSIADIHVHWQFPEKELVVFLNAGGILAAIPLPEKNRYRFIFQREGKPTMEEIQALLNQYVGPNAKLYEPVWMANFFINSRRCSTYRKGRVFLAGDAAHIHSPAGGQGMNTGLQDIYNLAWKLAYVHKKQAWVQLLDTYNTERCSWGKKLIRNTEWGTYVATLRNPLGVFLRNLVLRFLLRTPYFRSFVPSVISQTHLQYPKSPIVIEKSPLKKGPKAGKRAPNVAIGETDLYSKIRGSTQFHMLFVNVPVVQLPNWIIPIAVEENPIYPIGIYLIRPDGYIAYRKLGLNHNFEYNIINGYYPS